MRRTLRLKPLVIFLLTILFSLTASNQVAAQTEDKVLAIVNGKTITQKDVDRELFSQIFPLQQQIYAIRKISLENLIARAVVENEAQKANTSFEKMIERLAGPQVEVSDNEVQDLYIENISAFGAMSADEAKQRIRFDLQSNARMENYRKAIARLKRETDLKVMMEEPRLPAISEIQSATIGPLSAPVTIIEFSDFQCPFCKSSQGALKQTLASYKDRVRLVFKQLPLEIHPDAFEAARASFCAAQQDRFWPFHDALFAADTLAKDSLAALGTQVGLDNAKFAECMESQTSRVAVQQDVREAKLLGINSTPTFVINGRLFRGAITPEQFKTAINDELSRVQSAIPGSKSQPSQ